MQGIADTYFFSAFPLAVCQNHPDNSPGFRQETLARGVKNATITGDVLEKRRTVDKALQGQDLQRDL
jgi:hypothetical protein